MSENTPDQITEKVDSGQYFKDAMNWYHSKFTNVQTQFSTMLIIGMAAFFAFFLSFLGLVGFLPVTDKKLFVIYQPVTTDTRLSVQTLAKPGDNPHLKLAQYYMSEYTKSREEYVPDRNDRNLNFVSLTSDDTTLQDYLYHTSPENPESPVIVYANRGRRDIVVRSVTFTDNRWQPVDNPENPERAVVKYTVKENFGNDGSKVSNYQANITFKYDKLEVHQETHELTKEPKIVITGYTTKLIGQ